MAPSYNVLLCSQLMGAAVTLQAVGLTQLSTGRVPDEGVAFPGTGSFSWQKHKRPSHTLQAQIRPLLTCDVCGVWSFCWANHKAQPNLVGGPVHTQGTDSAQMLQDRFFLSFFFNLF